MHKKILKPISSSLLMLTAGCTLWPICRASSDVPKPAKKTTAQAAAPAATLPKFGEVTVSGDPTIVFEQNPHAKAIDVDLRSNRVVITSARYDIAAPHIQLTLKNKLVSKGTATGGAEVHIRNPEEKQHSSLTCTTANYYGATLTEPAHMHLIGPVHALLYDPQLSEPLDTTAESCDVILMADGTNKITLNNGHATVTPIEPPAKAKANAPIAPAAKTK